MKPFMSKNIKTYPRIISLFFTLLIAIPVFAEDEWLGIIHTCPRLIEHNTALNYEVRGKTDALLNLDSDILFYAYFSQVSNLTTVNSDNLQSQFTPSPQQLSDLKLAVQKSFERKVHKRKSQFFMDLGVILLFCLSSYAIIYFIKQLFRRNILRENAVKKSVIIRRVYWGIRFVILIMIVTIAIILLIRFIDNAHYVIKSFPIRILTLGGCCAIILYLISTIKLPVNFTTMNKFTKTKRNYCLYLRGFNTDNYSPHFIKVAEKVMESSVLKILGLDNLIERSDPAILPLNERLLARVWKKHFQLVSIGCPEELESPEGFKRIYVNNKTWHSDAIELMKNAKIIIINVNANESCLWEIMQCNDNFSEKTIYFIDKIKILNDILDKIGDHAPKCLKSPLIDRDHMCIYQIENRIIADYYENTLEGLSLEANYILADNPCK